jgi:predicted MFS family arabinose efflux permease
LTATTNTTDNAVSPAQRSALTPRILLTLLYSRTVSNMSYRVLYPFLPAVARGLGVSLEAAGRLVSAQGAAWILAPFLGQLSDRYGRRRVMELGLLLLAFACAMVFLTGQYPLTLMAFVGIGVARALYDPTTQAYVGDLVPYAQRGRAIATISMAWSLSWLLGVPLSGLLIQRLGWQVPWGFFSLFIVVALVATRLFLPPSRNANTTSRPFNPLAWGPFLRRGHVRAALATGFGIVFAVENLFIVYGAFLEGRFGLSIGAIGILSVIVGFSELLGEGASYLWTDKLGKKRSIVVGLVAYAVSLLVLFPLSGTLPTALFGFALVFFFFEFSIVSFFPLMSEVAPEARGTVISMNVAGMGSARLLAPIVGTLLYGRFGTLLPNALLSAAVCLVAAAILWRGVRE